MERIQIHSTKAAKPGGPYSQVCIFKVFDRNEKLLFRRQFWLKIQAKLCMFPDSWESIQKLEK